MTEKVICSTVNGWKMGLATTHPCGLLRLTPFPSARRGGTTKLFEQQLLRSLFCRLCLCLHASMCQGINDKRMPCDILLL